MSKFKKGNAFVREKLGSATMINVDGEWQQDFADGPVYDKDYKEDEDTNENKK